MRTLNQSHHVTLQNRHLHYRIFINSAQWTFVLYPKAAPSLTRKPNGRSFPGKTGL